MNHHRSIGGFHRQICQESSLQRRFIHPQYQLFLKDAHAREASKKLPDDVEYWENLRSWHCRAFQANSFQDFASKELRERYQIEDALFIYLEKWRCLTILKGPKDNECFEILCDIYKAMEVL